MELKPNCTPHLRMHEITKMLFNNKFLSDIQFKVDGEILFAHSLELMKRSEIFEEKLLQNFGKTKTIKIDDCSYAIFFEFIKFLYTDDCEINESNGIGLLKLATKYNVIILENKIINSIATAKWILHLFEYSASNHYNVVREQIKDLISVNYGDCLRTEKNFSIGENIVFIASKLANEYIPNNQFTNSLNQLVTVVRNGASPPFLLGAAAWSLWEYYTSPSMIKKWKHRFEWRKFKCETVFETTFSVSQEMILHALWIGIEEYRKDIEIIIKEMDGFRGKEIRFTQSAPDYWQPMLIALGKSIVLRPNCEYTVSIKYLGIAAGDIHVVSRMKDVDLVIDHDTRKVIKILKSSDNMLEILLNWPTKLRTNCNPS